jgi:hypothetical protein
MTPNYRAFWALIAQMPLSSAGLLKTGDGRAKLVRGPDYSFDDDQEALVLL